VSRGACCKLDYGSVIERGFRWSARGNPKALGSYPQTLDPEVFNQFPILPLVSDRAEIRVQERSEERNPAITVPTKLIRRCARDDPNHFFLTVRYAQTVAGRESNTAGRHSVCHFLLQCKLSKASAKASFLVFRLLKIAQGRLAPFCHPRKVSTCPIPGCNEPIISPAIRRIDTRDLPWYGQMESRRC
jgi:hypothetical protein